MQLCTCHFYFALRTNDPFHTHSISVTTSSNTFTQAVLPTMPTGSTVSSCNNNISRTHYNPPDVPVCVTECATINHRTKQAQGISRATQLMNSGRNTDVELTSWFNCVTNLWNSDVNSLILLQRPTSVCSADRSKVSLPASESLQCTTDWQPKMFTVTVLKLHWTAFM